MNHSALELAALIRSRQLGVAELVRHHLDLVFAKNPQLGSFVSVLEARALRTARRLDRELARRGDRDRWPRFFGLPTGLKDDSPVRFSFMQIGSRALRYFYTPVDGPVASRCRDAGMILVGKLATSELTILPFVHTELHPPARNPLDPSRYAGGSSGGSAAAVAAGMLPIAPGSDGAGSIRIPASLCGLVGIKPSRGAVVNPFGMVDPFGLSSVGAIGKNVHDAAALLDVLAGDPWHRDPPRPGSFLSVCDEAPPRLRLKLCLRSPLLDVDPEVEACVRGVAGRLASLGHHVEDGEPMLGSVDEFLPIMQRILASAPLLPFTEQLLQPTSRWMRAEGRRRGRAEMLAQHDRLQDQVLAWFGDADGWILPTVGMLAPRVGAFDGLDGEGTLRAAAPMGAFTAAFNVTGQPAASIPAGRTASGLSIGAQLVTRPKEDRLLLRLCAELESSLAR